MDGYLMSQLLYVTAKLGIADELAEGPRDTEALARAVGAQPGGLRRVLRGLAAEGVLDERPDDSFSLTPLGTCLRSDVPGSLRGSIIGRGELFYGAAAGLIAAVQHGGVAFERIHGFDYYDYLNQHPELGAAFQAAMTDRSRREAADVVAVYDFGTFERVVDVGGGQGVLLEAILKAAPRPRGVLFDQPPVVEQAAERLATAGLADRCDFVPGDFFTGVPPGGDAYLLSRVIHNWDDEAALRILTNCRAAIGDRGFVLLVEAVLPELAREQPAAIRTDLVMLTLVHGRERTGAEYERLLRAAGFRLTRIVPTGSPVGISVIEATPGPLPDRGD
jgi:hypothetical protein